MPNTDLIKLLARTCTECHTWHYNRAKDETPDCKACHKIDELRDELDSRVDFELTNGQILSVVDNDSMYLLDNISECINRETRSGEDVYCTTESLCNVCRRISGCRIQQKDEGCMLLEQKGMCHDLTIR